jgi:hypothetical protein
VPELNQKPSNEQPGDDRPGLDLDAIVARALRLARQYVMPDETDQDDLDRLTDFDVPQLVAEVRAGRIALEKARAQIANHQPVLAALTEAREGLAELEKDARTLASLRAYGVDNWDGYDDAIQAVSE